MPNYTVHVEQGQWPHARKKKMKIFAADIDDMNSKVPKGFRVTSFWPDWEPKLEPVRMNRYSCDLICFC